jgi:hypothetical protein
MDPVIERAVAHKCCYCQGDLNPCCACGQRATDAPTVAGSSPVVRALACACAVPHLGRPCPQMKIQGTP